MEADFEKVRKGQDDEMRKQSEKKEDWKEVVRDAFSKIETMEKFELMSDLLRDVYRSVRDDRKNRRKELEDSDEKFENDKKEKKYSAYLDGWKNQMNNMILKNFEFEDSAKCIKMLNKHADAIFCMTTLTTNDGKEILASGGYDCEIRLWDVETFDTIALLDSHNDAVTCLCVYREKDNELFLASGSFDHTLKLWDVEGELCEKTLTGHSDTIKSVIKINNGNKDIIFTGGADKKILVWDPEEQNYIDAFYNHRAEINALAVINEAKFMFASGGSDNIIKIWEYTNFKEKNCIKNLKGHNEAIWTLSTVDSLDKVFIVSGSADWTLKLWDIDKDESSVFTFDGFSKTVSSIALVKLEGKEMIVTGSHDGNVKIWDIQTKKCKKTIATDHFMGVFAICPFNTNNGKSLIASSGGETKIKIWDFEI